MEIFEETLRQSPEEALRGIGAATAAPGRFWLPPSAVAEPFFEGRVDGSAFRVRVRRARRTPTLARLEGEVFDFGGRARLRASVSLAPFVAPFAFTPLVSVGIVLAAFVSLLAALPGLAGAGPPGWALPVFSASALLIACMVLHRAGRAEARELEAFIRAFIRDDGAAR